MAMASIAHDARADDLTIYRCVDGKGKLTLRDSPCLRGEKQQTREMIRPRDAPPERIVRSATTPTSPPARTETIRYVTVAAPRPLYECAAPDGTRYTSESPQGQPRWQPLWAAMPMTPGYSPPGYPGYPPVTIAGGGASASYQGRHGSARIEMGRQVIGAPAYTGYAYPVAMGGTWVYDACTPLSPAEICARLTDRQWEICRRYVHAMPSERAEMDRESATLDARLANECNR